MLKRLLFVSPAAAKGSLVATSLEKLGLAQAHICFTAGTPMKIIYS